MIIHDEFSQGSEEWLNFRAGKPSASNFGKIITAKGEPSKQSADYAIELGIDAFAGKPVDAWEGNAATERGKELESEAAALYGLLTGAELSEVGFITDDNDQYGCSPDRMTADDGLLEVKCLMGKNHYKAIARFKKDGTCDPKYIPQVQGQLWVTGRSYCDLFFYNPVMAPVTIRFVPDLDMFSAIETNIAALLKDRDEVLATLRRHAK